MGQSQAGDTSEAGDHFGATLAAGKLDGDGYADLAVGAPDEDNGTVADGGFVNIVYGASGGLSTTRVQGLSQGNGAGTIEAGDRFGGALAVGDIDGDRYGDLAVGAPGEDTASGVDVGVVNVLYGTATTVTSARSQELSQSQAGGTAEAGDHFGAALAVANFDGLGNADLAVGAPDEDSGASADVGFVNLIYGTSKGLTTS